MERLDELSKLLAESVSRRESLRNIGVVFAGAVLGSLGVGTAWAARPDRCGAFCRWCSNKAQRNQCLAACRACNGNTSRLCGSCGAYVCTNLNNDFNNCGGCGVACDDPAPYEEGACVAGACVYGCVAGAIVCNGTCTPVNWDANNCGTCGNVCPASTPVCIQGTCGNCPPGRTNCSGECVLLDIDSLHCGACGYVCDPALSCIYGTCQYAGE